MNFPLIINLSLQITQQFKLPLFGWKFQGETSTEYQGTC